MTLQAAASIAISAFLLATSASVLVNAFSPWCFSKSYGIIFQSKLNYRSIYHGPDVQPLTEIERLGAAATKMDKNKIQRYGPGDFEQFVDVGSQDIFDGGDSEMGLSGDGSNGLKTIGRDVTPHMARTFSSKTDPLVVASCPSRNSYSDELLENNPSMDLVRAQQLENWAMQQEIARSNRYLNMRGEIHHSQSIMDYHDSSAHEDSAFTSISHDRYEIEGIITLRTPINSIAVDELAMKNLYMGWAKFRASFVGDNFNEWSVSYNDSFLKSHEDTHFVLRYTPHRPGVSNAYFVVETEDFTKMWKVVGSTGEYAFSEHL